MQVPHLEFVPPNILAQLANMKPFTLLLQKKGPNYNSPDALKIIQSEHLPHLFQLREKGIVLISVPVMDDSDVSAIAIYDMLDKDEIKRMTDEDPAVQKGIFIYELLSCMGMKGDSLQ
ncbi:MAG: hypothetical protein ACK4TA_04895 [Saprospiraceae bacterium]